MLIYGLKVSLLGIAVVFVALFILMVIVKLQSKFLIPTAFKKERLATDEISMENQSVLTSEELQENDDEIAVVIAAAIAASGKQVTVKNITRIYGNQVSPWAKGC